MSDARATYLTAGDLARIIGVTPGAVRALVARGRLTPAATTVGGVALYTPASIDEYRRVRAEYQARRAAGRRPS